MNRARNDYYLDAVDKSEILTIFLAYFGRAQQPFENQERFHTNDDTKILDVYFAREEIERIDDNLNQLDFEELRNKIKSSLIDNSSNKIGQVICFSSEKIAGAFKYIRFLRWMT